MFSAEHLSSCFALLYIMMGRALSLLESRSSTAFDWEIYNNIPDSSVPTANFSTLRFVAVMTRHGSRAPIYTYPNDPFPATNRIFWPEGEEELTNYGKMQLYNTGKLLRRRYSDFLNVHYIPEENIIRSNRVNRIFNSVSLLLAGLYPPRAYQVWNDKIFWQPIPIWEDPFDVAPLVFGVQCPKFATEVQIATTELNKKSGKYRDLLKYLSKNTGLEIANITDIIPIFDTLHLQEQNGFELPKWAESVYPELLAPLFEESIKTCISGTPIMVRLGGGRVLRMISEQLMEKAYGNKEPGALLFIDGCHDSTLQSLLTGLGFESTFLIDTSAFMVFELHKSPSRDFTLEFLYFNNSDHTVPNKLDPPNCPNPCFLVEFNAFVKSISPESKEAWQAECNAVDPSYYNKKLTSACLF